jgi:ATP-dependent metalloprotease
LANLINYAALRAAANSQEAVEMKDLEWAKDRILMGTFFIFYYGSHFEILGTERKNAVISEQNRKVVAFHEAGHALVAWYTDGAKPIYKATIMPRGAALGMVTQLPEDDEMSWTRRQLVANLDVCMGGRCAEELIFGPGEITSGASSDVSRYFLNLCHFEPLSITIR